MVFEVDGFLHEKNLYADNERDKEIRKILGADWEVVRIKTKYLEQNAEMLVEAIKAVRDEKKRLRQKIMAFCQIGIPKESLQKLRKSKTMAMKIC